MRPQGNIAAIARWVVATISGAGGWLTCQRRARLASMNLAPEWRTVLRDMHDPLIIIDPDGHVLELNARAEALVGMKSGSAIKQKVDRVFANWQELGSRLSNLSGAATERFELECKLESPEKCVPHERWHGGPVYDVRISRVGDPARPCARVVVMREITDQKRAEEERVRALAAQVALAESEAANRAKEGLLATLSHELRTPLTPVLATVTAMLDDREIPTHFRHVLEMIRRNVVLEAGLIDDLLELTRARSGRLELELAVVNVHDLIGRLVDQFLGPLHKSGIVLNLHLTAAEPHVNADERRLEQVLRHLLENAHKFTPNGGVVTITTRSATTEASYETGHSAAICVEVSDTGMGIDPELFPRIFDTFEQGRESPGRRQGGLGIGLAISRSIVEAHGGRLTAASEGLGLGATFGVHLPVLEAIQQRHNSGLGSKPLAEHSENVGKWPSYPVRRTQDGTGIHRTRTDRRGVRILLVEDNSDTLNYLTTILRTRGHEVRPACDLSTALKIADQTAFDMLVSDIELPDGSGLELMSRLRARGLVSGIAVSGFGSPEDVEMSRAAGFADHLTKPIDFRTLEATIQRLSIEHGLTGMLEN